ATDQRLAVEVALTRMARPETDLTLEALAERIAALETGQTAMAASRAAEPERAERQRKVRPAAEPSTVSPPAPNQPEAAFAAAVSGGRPDLASIRRAWPAIVAEFKKLKPSRSHLFDSTELEVVADTVVIEFPREQGFAIELARKPETLEVLRRSIFSVLKIQPPIEFRLGREGVSTLDATAAADTTTAGAAPEAVPSVPTAPLDAKSTAASQTSVDVEARLINELGAQIVEEREHNQED
ncbi:MAG: hypothetical protein LLG24_07215, partial [Actinomycetia bacterium]|nr:hypothetical protein [Actinomycetes bacterium]